MPPIKTLADLPRYGYSTLGFNRPDKHVTDRHGNTLLHTALNVTLNNTDLLKQLLKDGVDPNAWNDEGEIYRSGYHGVGETPLLMAIRLHAEHAVKELISHPGKNIP